MTQMRFKATAAAQTNFSIRNHGFKKLTFYPSILLRIGVGEPFQWISEKETSSSGGNCNMTVRQNEHGQDYGYAESTELVIHGPNSRYRFYIEKKGNLAHYTTISPHASVATGNWIFEDFPTFVYLIIDASPENLSAKAENTFEYEVDSENRVIECSRKTGPHLAPTKGVLDPAPKKGDLKPAPTKKEGQVVFPDTEAFSFLSNVNLYFSGAKVYRMGVTGEIQWAPQHGQGNPSLGNGYFLTPDGGYPEGRTELTIKDGFSDATAVVAFDHKDGEVTMTIKSYESRLCDIRDASFAGIVAKHCICIAL